MIGSLDPTNPNNLSAVCTSDLGTASGVAYPGIRFVQLAHQFGANAYVDSICKGNWTGAIEGILKKLQDRIPFNVLRAPAQLRHVELHGRLPRRRDAQRQSRLRRGHHGAGVHRLPARDA